MPASLLPDTTIINTNARISYVLYLADNALILGHRNSEWCGHGPALEQDIALSNIALDLLGQARHLYQYAAELYNQLNPSAPVTEDHLAYLRDVRDFRNCLLAEQPNGHWGQTVLRQFFFSCWQYYFYQQLQHSNDTQLQAIAIKSLKEVTYHLRWSSEWVIRLGDGTAESKTRMQQAAADLWPYTHELFQPAAFEQEAVSAGYGVTPGSIEKDCLGRIQHIFSEATLSVPVTQPGLHSGGKTGVHTEHLGFILAEMQFLQRAYPGSEW
ncbi:1,2-phenylacetyl-CoA epoxidase subunit PaaC [Deminuibacter soli]|uniref:Phenylacetate-CoA oxygenase subunit PaaI n=1 Tax=Deminuibacter soli TaxID=2291815 RepID=A0A3E1NPU1_9BACT|nr:1,2-phenylacetyl-CoA epoxidase subunit PaaC [Deminuibacter soli]RFM29942.1 phenylacetate-CoA oxygenase subunit PaaI [Deminuibacter soli]